MTDSVEQQLIDAITAEIEARADLPDHQVVKYRRPRSILPDDCPVLVVWVDGKTPIAISNVQFDSVLTIGVSWHESTVEEAQTLINDSDQSIALLNAMKALEQRIRDLATAAEPSQALNIEGAWQILPGPTLYDQMQEGLVEGYALSVVVNVTEK